LLTSNDDSETIISKMKLVEEIDRHEVLRKWAIGEVYSRFFNPTEEVTRKKTLEMLQSNNYVLQKEGIDQVLEVKKGLINSMSLYIKWYKAILELTRSDLDLVYTLQLPGWKRNTNGSYLIADAAEMIYKTPKLDNRVNSIYQSFKKNGVCMEGITLLAVDKIGPYVAVEGTGRLTSLYILQQIEQIHILKNNNIEITLGIY
jgi:hypothetical protein